jgi:hypothetical protein
MSDAKHAVMDEDRRVHDDGPEARTHDRLDDDIAEQGRFGNRDMPTTRDLMEDVRQSER